MVPDENEPHIVTDEDWKSRVKAEDAALDQKLREDSADHAPSSENAASAEPEPAAAERTPRDVPPQMPPANFSLLVTMFSTQAMVSMGLISHPETRKSEVQLPLAKHFIDLLGVLEAKTAGNLDEHERALLDDSLHQLRMAYVEMSKRSK